MPPTPIPPSEAVALHGMTSDEALACARSRLARGAGKARAVYRRVVREGRFEPEALGLGAAAAEGWRRAFAFELPEVVRVVQEDGPEGPTRKAVLRTDDGLEHECVSIPMGRDRFTLCVSSQVGCKMGCRFCETGRMGLLRHLSAAEMVGQVLLARHRLGWPVRNVVFMGMGEALDNFDGLRQALQVLTDPGGMAMAQERITVCTVGHVDGIRRLAELGLKRLNLSVSLNSARDEVRRELMPIGRRYPLAELQVALRLYRPRRNFALGVNYCLMPGINDTREDAARIADFCRPLARVLVNLIPYNPGTAPLTRAPEEHEVERFVAWLRAEGLPVRRRITKGRAVMAACGQLGNAGLRNGARRRLGSQA
ncbi:MAG: 23S rRNA (adenine(2503)-C(2))-methyltransferase RlmN [Myxococcota bacterium]